MPRKSRTTTDKGFYHVMMRGNNRQNIFLELADKFRFLDYLEKIINTPLSISGKETGRYEVYAYALMSNHFHLLVKVEEGTIGDFVKRLASSYVTYFNKKYHRDGHLFKERFRSEVCETDEYFKTLLRYIHQNPIKAGLCTDLMYYQFTSWPEYVKSKGYPYRICSVDKVLERIPLPQVEAIVYDLLPDNQKCLDVDKASGKISESIIRQLLKDKYCINDPGDIKARDLNDRKEIIKDLLEFGATISQINKLTGISKSSISLINKKLRQ